jgi:hypothetical protein
MKLPAHGTDSFRERGFDVQMDIFERLIPSEFTGFDFAFDCTQLVLDLLPLISGYGSSLNECCGMCNRPCNIVSI